LRRACLGVAPLTFGVTSPFFGVASHPIAANPHGHWLFGPLAALYLSFYLPFTRKSLWTTTRNTRSPYFGNVVVIGLLKKFI